MLQPHLGFERGRIVHQRGQPAELAVYCFEQPDHFILYADVRLNRDRVAAILLNRRDHLRRGRLILEIVDAHGVPALCSMPSRRGADAPAASSDDQSFQDVGEGYFFKVAS